MCVFTAATIVRIVEGPTKYINNTLLITLYKCNLRYMGVQSIDDSQQRKDR